MAQSGSSSVSDVQRILAAARFAAEKHAYQKRKGEAGEPYINHLLEVAELVAATMTVLDPNLLIAAFLHDTVEDTRITAEEIRERFGSDVEQLVMEMTDDKSLPNELRKGLQVQNADKLSPRAQTLKLADKISNLRAILSSPPRDWSLERKQQYFNWARDVVSRLSEPNPLLKQEFEQIHARSKELKG